MRSNLQDFMLFTIVVFVLSEFMSSFLLYGSYAQTNIFPSQTYLAFQTALSSSQSIFATHFSGWFISWVNQITGALAYLFALFWYIANVFWYYALVIGWYFGLFSFMFHYIPYPYGSLVQILLYAFVGVYLLMSIRVGNSGVHGRGT